MRVLVVNFQDRRHPFAGGAEVHLHEVFGRLAQRGHDVTLLASGWRGAERRERLDGIDVHRVGARATFPWLAPRYFRRHLACEWDGTNIGGSPAKFAFWRRQTDVAQGAASARGGIVNYVTADRPEQVRNGQVSEGFFQLLIGVVANSRDNGLNRDPEPKMFIPQAQVPDAVNALNMRLSQTVWLVRTRVSPSSVSGAVQVQLRQATGLPVSDIRSMDEVAGRSTSRTRFNMVLMTISASSALLLAAIGIYGVMAYVVQQRAREIGVRMALGAEPSAVRSMVVKQGMRLAIVGLVAGLAAAYGLSRYMSSLLFGVEPRDPLVFVGVPLVLMVVALAAVWIPARRASRVDPLGALRGT